MLALAGLQQNVPNRAETSLIPPPIQALITRSSGISITVCDRILTPILWNGLADAIYRHSAFENPVERNGLVRALFDPYFIAFLGAEREKLVFNAVGMFRLDHTSPSPSPLARDVYERISEHPLFQEAWTRRLVCSALTGSDLTVRVHPLVGTLNLYALDFDTAVRGDLIVRSMSPADDETAAKFVLLEQNSNEQPKTTERQVRRLA